MKKSIIIIMVLLSILLIGAVIADSLDFYGTITTSVTIQEPEVDTLMAAEETSSPDASADSLLAGDYEETPIIEGADNE